MPKFNSMFDVGFTLEHNFEKPEDIPATTLLAALEVRLNYLKSRLDEVADAIGHCDTYATKEPDPSVAAN